MDPVKVAQMVEVLNGLTAREAPCLLVGCTLTILDEARNSIACANSNGFDGSNGRTSPLGHKRSVVRQNERNPLLASPTVRSHAVLAGAVRLRGATQTVRFAAGQRFFRFR
jgi:hypothetical protein